jgi:hypothetical protein
VAPRLRAHAMWVFVTLPRRRLALPTAMALIRCKEDKTIRIDRSGDI